MCELFDNQFRFCKACEKVVCFCGYCGKTHCLTVFDQRTFSSSGTKASHGSWRHRLLLNKIISRLNKNSHVTTLYPQMQIAIDLTHRDFYHLYSQCGCTSRISKASWGGLYQRCELTLISIRRAIHFF